MKVLKFLIHTDYNLLSKKIIEYLIDAGHFVWVVDSDENTTQEWSRNFTHNFEIIKNEDIEESKFDYLLSFTNGGEDYTIPKIEIRFKFSVSKVIVNVLLTKGNKSSIVVRCDTKFTGDTIDILYDEITGAFIDAVVYLLRFGNDNLRFSRRSINGDDVSNLLKYEKQVDALTTYYQSIDTEDVFFVQNLGVSSKRHRRFNIMLGKEHRWEREDLEIFAIYLLALLNGRREDVYGYDCYLSRKISKFISIKLPDRKNDLLAQLNNKTYDLVRERFYERVPPYKCSITNDVAIGYDNVPPFREYLLSIVYSNKREEIVIRYTEGLDFFDEIKEHVVNFLERYSSFKLNRCNFSDLLRLSEKNLHKLLFEWNKTDVEYPKDKTVHELFEDQVAKTPDNIAVEYEGDNLTYRELNEKSNQLARYIRKEHKQEVGEELKPDTLIALCLDRSLEMIVGILGVLKSGGAYVPIDPKYPSERIKFILEDTGSRLLLTQNWLKKQLTMHSSIKVLSLDDTPYSQELASNLSPYSKSEDLIYVIYTSGTTGQPKGVMIKHNCVINLINWTQSTYELTNDDSVLQKSHYTFDASVWELFWVNCYGAKLVLARPEGHRDSDYLHELIKSTNVTILQFVPSMLEVFGEFLTQNGLYLPNGVKVIFCGGEELREGVVRKYYELSKNSEFALYNVYGPTECSIDVTYKLCKLGEQVRIGSHIQNTKLYVLDVRMNPVPVGVIGELYVGGACLARGYLNRDKLTVDRFVENPFSTKEDKAKGYTRLYKTGDLVRWLPSGELEYIGRNDFQVKVRGYRIELGEIESVLLSYPKVKQAVVLAKSREQDNSNYLVAYYVSPKSISQDKLFKYLEDALPEYMVPSGFVHMEELPLSTSGKLDRRALPDPEFVDRDQYIAPTTELEERMCVIWQEVLRLEKVGIRDDFFRIGGDSMSAIRLIVTLSETGVICHIKDLFAHRTIEKLVKYATFEGDVPAVTRNIDHGFITAGLSKSLLDNLEKEVNKINNTIEAIYPATSLQQGFIAHSLSYPEDDAYRVQVLFDYKIELDIASYKKAWEELIVINPILRTGFNWQEQLVQIIYSKGELDYQYHDISKEKDKEEAIRSIQVKDRARGFDLDKSSLLRVHVIKQASDLYTILFSHHHIILDGWSIPILLSKVGLYYDKLRSGEIISDTVDNSYLDAQYYYHEHRKGTEEYWSKELELVEGCNDLSVMLDSGISINQIRVVAESADASLIIENGVYKDLQRICRELGVTLNILVQFAWHKLIQVCTRDERTIVGTTVSGRGIPISAVDGSIGLYINTLPLIVDWQDGVTIKEQLGAIHEQVMGLNSHSFVDLSRLQRDGKRLFHSLFVFQNIPLSNNSSSLNPIIRENIQKLDYPFSVEAFEDERGLHVNLKYDSSVLCEARAQDHLYRVRIILFSLKSHLEEFHNSISLLTDQEYAEIVYGWNETDVEYPKSKTVYELFEVQVGRTPDNVALEYEGDTLTYSELNEKSNQLARYIRKEYAKEVGDGINPDTLIALYLDRSLEMIIGILGVLKSGGAYVPIDPKYPSERTRFILEDTGSRLLLTQNWLKKQLTMHSSIKVLSLDDTPYSQELSSNLRPYSKSEDLIYVIYTSGTTGQPKGVMIAHDNVVNLCSNLINQFQLQEYKIIQFANYVFDASIFEIFTPLLCCGTVSIIPERTKSGWESII